MLKLVVKNFQSIEDARLLVEGVTVIRGDTSSGKSACLRALQACCTNRFRSGQVRHGTENCTIMVQDPEKNAFLQCNRPLKGSVSYTLGDQHFDKTARTLPKPVAEWLNLVNYDDLSVNFKTQFTPPLLKSLSQNKVMGILSQSDALDTLNKAQKARSTRSTEINGALKSLNTLLEDQSAQFDKHNAYCERYADQYQRAVDLRTRQEQLKARKDTLTALKDVLQALGTQTTKVSKYEAYVEKYKALKDVCITQSTCSSMLDDMHEARRITRSKALYSEFIAKYVELRPRLEKVAVCENLLRAFAEWRDTHRDHTNYLAIVNNMKARLERLSSNTDRRKLCETLLLDMDSARMVVARRKELENIITNKLCPLCGQPLNH